LNTQLIYQIALTKLEGIGPAKAKALITHFGSAEAIFSLKKSTLAEVPGIGMAGMQKFNFKQVLLEAEKEVEFIHKHKIDTHFYIDSSYPRRLKQCQDGPILLFSKGEMDLNKSRMISIVGTRNATTYGKNILDELIESISALNVSVISGLALGIDIFAHRLCIQKEIETIGVLGHGLDRIYPAIHKSTAQEMMFNGGLLTEFLPNTNPDRENFPMRNRIVAGMCDATIVIESGDKGGSLITANLANDYQREVFAFPGDISRPFSKGCNRLIQENKAHLITCGADFLKIMNWESKNIAGIQKSLFQDFNPEETLIMTSLEKMEVASFDYLFENNSLSQGSLSALLLNMEMSGYLKSLPGKRYQRA
jgi:DNA processing protein